MGPLRAQRTVTVVNAQGLHLRPLDMFVKLAGQYESRIELEKMGDRVDGKSILAILTLSVEMGAELTIEAFGDDSEEAADALAQLIASGFPEENTTNNT